MANVGTAAPGQTLIGAGNGASPTFASIGTNSGLTLHGIVIAQGNGAFVASNVLGNGQLLIGSNASNPVPATLTAGSGITITNGAGQITIAVTAGSTVVETLTGNSGGAISPTAGNINTVGTGSITIAGAGSTLTTQLTGLTNHAIQVGAGTATLTQLAIGSTGQVLQANSAADPSWSTATYPSTTTINQILFSSAANTVGGLATANSSVLVTSSTGVPSLSGAMTNGQLIIGSTGATPTAATLSAGTGVSITNAAASITINAVGGGMTWTLITANQVGATNNGYIANKGSTATISLPTTSAVGDFFGVTGINNATGWQITQAAGQQIFFGTASTTSGATGTLTSSATRDSVIMVCVAANLTWNVLNSVGNPTVV